MKTDRPIILTSNAVNLLSGSTAVADLTRVRQSINAPVVIDRVNFILRSPQSSSAPNAFNDIAASIGCRIQVGRHYLSADFIPVWSYCQTMGGGQSNVTNGNFYSTPGSTINTSQYSWKLPKPLFVPKDSIIVPHWNRLVDGLGTTATAQIAFGGAVLASGIDDPATTDIPWVSHWRASLPAAGTQSGENDLKNWLDKTVRVQRLIGRVLHENSAQTDFREDLVDPARSINVKVTDWNGYALTDDFTRWTNVFDPNRRSWNIGYDVPSGKSLRVETGPYTSQFLVAANTAYVSAIGYRGEAL